MTGMARKLALTAVATFVVGGALATSAHADDSAVNLPLTDEVRAELVEAGAVLTGRAASEFGGLRRGGRTTPRNPSNGVNGPRAALYANPGEYWPAFSSRIRTATWPS